MQKILIVEDDQTYQKVLKDFLSVNGYRVLQAYDGKEGLRLANSEKPELILLDVLMPIMDGLAMLTELRKSAYGKTANVIFLTNYDADDIILKSVTDNKPLFYFVKSNIDLKSLLEKITDLVPRSK